MRSDAHHAIGLAAEKARKALKQSQKTCPWIAYCFLRFQRKICSGAFAQPLTVAAGYIGEESDISCFYVRQAAVPHPPAQAYFGRPFQPAVQGLCAAGSII